MFTTGSKNLKSSAIAEHVRSKLIEYSLLTVIEVQAKSCDFILNPDQQSDISQMHLTELQCCQYLALVAVAIQPTKTVAGCAGAETCLTRV